MDIKWLVQSNLKELLIHCNSRKPQHRALFLALTKKQEFYCKA
jgi:hypothetical protein